LILKRETFEIRYRLPVAGVKMASQGIEPPVYRPERAVFLGLYDDGTSAQLARGGGSRDRKPLTSSFLCMPSTRSLQSELITPQPKRGRIYGPAIYLCKDGKRFPSANTLSCFRIKKTPRFVFLRTGPLHVLLAAAASNGDNGEALLHQGQLIAAREGRQVANAPLPHTPHPVCACEHCI